MAELACPERFRDVAVILERRGLPGLTFFWRACRFVACYCSRASYAEFCARIRVSSGCTSLSSFVDCESSCFTVAWHEYAKLQSLYDAIARENVGFTIGHPMSHWGFFPRIGGTTIPCTSENVETLAIARISWGLDDAERGLLGRLSPAHFDPWNWTTAEGREFCARLCREKGIAMKPMDHVDNFHYWPQYAPLESMLPHRAILTLAEMCAARVVCDVPASDVVDAGVPPDAIELIVRASERMQRERASPSNLPIAPARAFVRP